MFGHTYYHRTLRKYVSLFGTLFNDVYINRTDTSANTVSTYRIPIAYGPKQKTMARVEADPTLTRPYAVLLPRMSFEMTNMRYDPTRKLPTISRGYVKKVTTDENSLKYVYNPVPYDIDFQLNIMVKNAEDGTMILEQILPYFTPDWTTTVNIVPDLDVKLDIPIVINNVTSTDEYEGNFEDRRVLTWTLDFTLRGYLFGPVTKSGVIKLANVNFHTDTTTTAPTEERVTIQPGLTAGGLPTTDINETIDYKLIEEDDDWAYLVRTVKVSND